MPTKDGFYEYGFEYEYNGAKWGFTVWATDLDDARARIRLFPHAKHYGIIADRIPAGPGVGLYVRVRCWLRNLRLKFARKSA